MTAGEITCQDMRLIADARATLREQADRLAELAMELGSMRTSRRSCDARTPAGAGT